MTLFGCVYLPIVWIIISFEIACCRPTFKAASLRKCTESPRNIRFQFQWKMEYPASIVFFIEVPFDVRSRVNVTCTSNVHMLIQYDSLQSGISSHPPLPFAKYECLISYQTWTDCCMLYTVYSILAGWLTSSIHAGIGTCIPGICSCLRFQSRCVGGMYKLLHLCAPHVCSTKKIAAFSPQTLVCSSRTRNLSKRIQMVTITNLSGQKNRNMKLHHFKVVQSYGIIWILFRLKEV